MAKSKVYEMAVRIAGKVDKSLKTSCKAAEQAVSGIGGAAKTAAKVAATALTAVAVAATGVAASSLSTYSEFEQAMANTAAIAQATEAEYIKLEDAARAMGAATTKTATEAAEALGYMALAGWDAETSIKGLEPVLRLSEATQMDLARASDLVTDSMSALGVGVDDLNSYLDLAVQTNNKANTTAEELMEAFIGTGGAAKTTGVELNDLATALGILANNGTKGAEAGTAMNAMLVRMTSKDAAIKAMKALGVSAFDSAGEFVGLETVMTDLSRAMANLNTEQRAAYMSKIAGTNYYTEMSYLLDAVAESADGTATAWQQLEGQLEGSDGALMNMAEQITDTLQGSTAVFWSAVDEMKLSVGEIIAPYAKRALDWLANTAIPQATAKIQEVLPKLEALAARVFPKIQNAIAAVVPYIKTFFGWLGKVGAFAIKHKDTILALAAGFGAFAGTLVAVVNAMKAVKTVMSGLKIVSGLFGSTVGKTALIIGGVTAAIGLLVTAGVWLYQNWDTVKAKAQEIWAKVTEVWNNIKSSVSESIRNMVAAFQENFPIMSAFISGWWKSIQDVFENVKVIFSNIIDFVKNVFTGNWEAAWDNIINIFGNLFGMLVNLAKAPINGVISAINWVLGKINSISVTIPDWVPGVGGKTLGFNIPTIPALASGGIATAATLAMVGEGGEPEAILPLSKLAALLDEWNPKPRPGGGGTGTGDDDKIIFAPVFHFNGPASKGDVEAATKASFEEFKALYRRLKAEERRKSFNPV
ncbi:phage tail tape measure protein [Oscillospiraceae bacterium OttesenSCG-928-G22]|nr:phage tail tape measure protein [Oscillospiraceae bacterium OttesenSCG-928-G22]